MGTRIGSFRGVARMWLHFSALVLTLKLTKLQPLVTFTIIGLQNYHLNGYHPNHRVAALQYSAQYNMISPRRQRTRVSQSVSQSCIQTLANAYIYSYADSKPNNVPTGTGQCAFAWVPDPYASCQHVA